jgi:hypothetical protein
MSEMTTQREEITFHQAIFQAWDCVLKGANAIYLSGPITTGLRYIQALRSAEADQSRLNRVKQENEDDLVSAATLLRRQRNKIIVEPTSLRLPEWSSSDYHCLWERLIEKHIKLAIFLPGWQYSYGCAREFVHASVHNIRTEALSGAPISLAEGLALLEAARDDLISNDANGELAGHAFDIGTQITRLQKLLRPSKVTAQDLRKDKSLDLLAERGMNVAQFVSFSPEANRPKQEYSRLAGRTPNEPFADARSALETLLKMSSDQAINIRSYQPHDPQSREFIYGLTSVEAALSAIERLTSEGLHTIANETINVADGGVSGVLMGDILEFSPDDTPRCVEKPGTASLPRGLGCAILETVYRIPIEFEIPLASRLEFSLHPRPRGWKLTNLIAWEFSEQKVLDAEPKIVWPNKFSRLVGDKAFGLLVAHHLGLPVPHTTVIGRRVPAFSFGRPTGWHETWLRTAPSEQMPGLFTTLRGWSDPFVLMNAEDPDATNLSSIISQAGVYPAFSGALIIGADGKEIIEGRSGTGLSLMLGEGSPETLPENILADVHFLYKLAEVSLGPVRFEWVHDGASAWIVQLHRGATESTVDRLTPGDADQWVEFEVENGLAALRQFVSNLPPGIGLILRGRVGLTSHIADVIRKARIPAKLA